MDTVNERIALAEESLTKVSEDLEETREEIVTEIKEDLSSKADLVLNNTFSGEQVFSNDVTFGKTIYLNNVEDPDMSTTLDGSSLSTTNVTTFTINNNDLTFTDGEIVIGDKVLTFDGEDEVIPANSVTDEARVFARVAQESATVAEASMETAVASASAASISETNAANSATSAETNAALLGDAALQSRDNTFSGKNVFNGEMSGSGTLLGVPFSHWMGMSSIFSQFDIKASEFKALFPEWQTAEVWPHLRPRNANGQGDFQMGVKSNPPFITFFEVNESKGNWHEPGVGGECEEMWIYVKGNPWVVDYMLRAVKNYFIAPDWTGGHTISAVLDLRRATEKIISTIIYAPKLKTCSLGSRYDFNKTVMHEVTFACNPSSCEKLNINGPLSFRLLNANLSNCKLVSVNDTAYLDRETILTILGTLPTYDAATMTTVPTCTMFVDPEYEGDEELINAFLNLQTAVDEGGKGWTVAVSGISLTGAATLALHPTVYCKKWPASEGRYVDAVGIRWEVSSGTVAMRHYETNESIGYEQFTSLDEALTSWGLSEYMEIPQEEQNNN